MRVTLDRTQKIYDLNIGTKNTTLLIIITDDNVKYSYNDNLSCNKFIYSNIDYEYMKYFHPIYGSESGYYICKNKRCKFIIYSNIYNLFNTFYTYFIYNKYYNSKKIDKLYRHILCDSINSYKLFNCRDYYKILSFIIDL